jgi:hypothetical protein
MVLTSMKGVAYPIVPSMLAIRPEPLQTRLLDPPAVMIAAASLQVKESAWSGGGGSCGAWSCLGLASSGEIVGMCVY